MATPIPHPPRILNRTGGARRPGAAVVWLPLALLALLAIFALAINVGRLWTIRTEMQVAADAAALAGTDALVGDDLLRGDSGPLPGLLKASSAEAIHYAAQNLV